MEWTRAKNIIIILLLVTNAILFTMIYKNNEKYRLSRVQQESIVKVLENNDIIYNAEMIKTFKPMKKIDLMPYSFDHEQLKKKFFDNPDDCKEEIKPDGDVVIYHHEDNGTLYIYPQGFRFISVIEESSEDINVDKAKALCNELIKSFGNEFANFKYDEEIILNNSNRRFIFREHYKGYVIESNFIDFTVNNNGILYIDCNYLKVDGFSEEPKLEISSPLDALMYYVRQKTSYGIQDTVTIDRVSIVYSYDAKPYDNNHQAWPFYHMIINIGGSSESVLFNAYTKTSEVK